MNYITFSNYINAWSLHRGLAKLGINLRIAGRVQGLLPATPIKVLPGDTLFFTEEANLLKYYEIPEYNFYPKSIDKKIVDDKFNFACLLNQMGETPIQFWPVPDKINLQTIPEMPIYLKAKHSWIGEHKLPRGFMCNSLSDIQNALLEIQKMGLQKSHFFFQSLIPGEAEINYSTCGFFDFPNSQKTVILILQRLLNDTSIKIACSAIARTVRDPDKLIERTIKILSSIRYTGPFELEFIYDRHSHFYYILELNPRFWMQHGIFIDLDQNRLLTAYLNLESVSEEESTDLFYKPGVWVNSLFLCESVADRHFAVTKNIFRILIKCIKNKDGQILFFPNLLFSVGHTLIKKSRPWWAAFKRAFQKSFPRVL